MNKKALAAKTLVQIILFCFIALIFLAIYFEMTSFFLNKPAPGTIKSQERLVIEINSLDGQRQVPVYIDKGHVIRGFDSNGPGIGCKKGKSCICVCEETSCDAARDKNLKCSSIDFELANEFVINPFIPQGQKKPDVKNCLLSRAEKKVNVTGCVS